ncbi:hypothetical protein VNO77_05637 [Canavalia gladiata]|uniref:Uncharacterized protein n=1 Tax=Canavalia gladiata TaxID=3824 RepID=A0AAN9N3X2_CANGL
MGSLLQLLRLLDDGDDPAETRPRHPPNNPGVVAPHQPKASFNNTGTQHMAGLINNTGYTKGNGNGSIILGGFDSSTRNYRLVRGLADLIDGGDHSHRVVATQPQPIPNFNSPFPLQAPAHGLLNGDNQKLIGVTNNTNLKFKGDGNGALTLGNIK